MLSVLTGRSCTGFAKEKQQHSLVKVEVKVVDKHPTEDVREARTDEYCSAEMKLYQSPRVILPAVRGYKVKKVECCWSQSSRESYVM